MHTHTHTHKHTRSSAAKAVSGLSLRPISCNRFSQTTSQAEHAHTNTRAVTPEGGSFRPCYFWPWMNLIFHKLHYSNKIFWLRESRRMPGYANALPSESCLHTRTSTHTYTRTHTHRSIGALGRAVHMTNEALDPGLYKKVCSQTTERETPSVHLAPTPALTDTHT